MAAAAVASLYHNDWDDDDTWLSTMDALINTSLSTGSNAQEECDADACNPDAIRLKAAWKSWEAMERHELANPSLLSAEEEFHLRMHAALNSGDEFVLRCHFGESKQELAGRAEAKLEVGRAKRRRKSTLDSAVDARIAAAAATSHIDKKMFTESDRLKRHTCRYPGCSATLHERSCGVYICESGCDNGSAYEYHAPFLDEDDAESERATKQAHITIDHKDELKERLLASVVTVPKTCNIYTDKKIVVASQDALTNLVRYTSSTHPALITSTIVALANELLLSYHTISCQRKYHAEQLKYDTGATGEFPGQSNAPTVRSHESLAMVVLATASCVHGSYIPGEYPAAFGARFWERMRPDWGWADVHSFSAIAIETLECVRVVLGFGTCKLGPTERSNVMRLAMFVAFGIRLIGSLVAVYDFRLGSGGGGDDHSCEPKRKNFKVTARREWITRFFISSSGFGDDPSAVTWDSAVCDTVRSYMTSASIGTNTLPSVPEWWRTLLRRRPATIAAGIMALIASTNAPEIVLLVDPPPPPSTDIDPIPPPPRPPSLRFVPSAPSILDSKAPVSSPTEITKRKTSRIASGDSYRHAPTMAIINARQCDIEDRDMRKMQIKIEGRAAGDGDDDTTKKPPTRIYSGNNNSAPTDVASDIIRKPSREMSSSATAPAAPAPAPATFHPAHQGRSARLQKGPGRYLDPNRPAGPKHVVATDYKTKDVHPYGTAAVAVAAIIAGNEASSRERNGPQPPAVLEFAEDKTSTIRVMLTPDAAHTRFKVEDYMYMKILLDPTPPPGTLLSLTGPVSTAVPPPPPRPPPIRLVAAAAAATAAAPPPKRHPPLHQQKRPAAAAAAASPAPPHQPPPPRPTPTTAPPTFASLPEVDWC